MRVSGVVRWRNSCARSSSDVGGPAGPGSCAGGAAGLLVVGCVTISAPELLCPVRWFWRTSLFVPSRDEVVSRADRTSGRPGMGLLLAPADLRGVVGRDAGQIRHGGVRHQPGSGVVEIETGGGLRLLSV